jgi:hypothetical protein
MFMTMAARIDEKEPPDVNLYRSDWFAAAPPSPSRTLSKASRQLPRIPARK